MSVKVSAKRGERIHIILVIVISSGWDWFKADSE